MPQLGTARLSATSRRRAPWRHQLNRGRSSMWRSPGPGGSSTRSISDRRRTDSSQVCQTMPASAKWLMEKRSFQNRNFIAGFDMTLFMARSHREQISMTL
jgi:hypothetical protein